MVDERKLGPKGSGADVKRTLLEAGHAVYEERGLDGVSLREVAERAGVNQAMVRYYFKDKQGFEMAMLDDGVETLLSGLPEGGSFEQTFSAAVGGLNALPWLPLLMMRTVYVNDTLRSHFVTHHAPRLAAKIAFQLPSSNQYALLSVISMLVFPQLARRAIGPALGINYDNQFASDYAAHVAGLVSPQKTGEQ